MYMILCMLKFKYNNPLQTANINTLKILNLVILKFFYYFTNL